ncbi:hypothetical protein DPEC_G00019910 [Dallia pectoralis]|uniref:Uncharacterized protein n=1 Tax=Dallia pectoralis TaxID=75939 RepID=A0ACC2HFT8_DALPE|nr:hypothetical protein DPEC_G00019910 [Dallia pectoralis]
MSCSSDTTSSSLYFNTGMNLSISNPWTRLTAQKNCCYLHKKPATRSRCLFWPCRSPFFSIYCPHPTAISQAVLDNHCPVEPPSDTTYSAVITLPLIFPVEQ